METTFVLIHSPLTGPQIWWPVAERLKATGYPVLVPDLQDSSGNRLPVWQQHVNWAVTAISAAFPDDHTSSLVLVAHSGAGPLLGSIGSRLATSPAAYLFVDAGLPSQVPATRLDQMRSEGGNWVNEFASFLAAGGRFPAWTDADLREEVPNPVERKMVIDTLRPRGLDYFTETLEATESLPTLPGGYLQFTSTYRVHAEAAAALGWPVMSKAVNHFHMLVDPEAVAADIITLSHKVSGKR